MNPDIVTIKNLSRRYGKTQALDNVSLSVERGYVYGLVGANGQGKTTLIKHILGLLRAQEGSVRVFGKDPVAEPVDVLRNIGYLSEERDLPEWMQVGELQRYTAAYHPNWDAQYAQELVQTFRLPLERKIKQLSKGMRAQAGLIAAVAHRPELLLLDEPSTGLDAVVRKDILNSIIRAVADDGRTAIFSSHLLDEVEMMSDYILMIDNGQLVLEGELDEIKEKHQHVVFSTPDSSIPDKLDCLLSSEQHGTSWVATATGSREQIQQQLGELGAEIDSLRNASLQEIFVARAGRDMDESVAEEIPAGAH